MPFLPIALGIGSLLGSLFSKKTANGPSSQQLGQQTQADFAQLLKIPEVQQLIALQLQAAKRQETQAARLDPLQQAISQMALQLLPVHVRQGVPMAASNPAPGPRLAAPSINWPGAE